MRETILSSWKTWRKINNSDKMSTSTSVSYKCIGGLGEGRREGKREGE